jgi:hypothetical protein
VVETQDARLKKREGGGRERLHWDRESKGEGGRNGEGAAIHVGLCGRVQRCRARAGFVRACVHGCRGVRALLRTCVSLFKCASARECVHSCAFHVSVSEPAYQRGREEGMKGRIQASASFQLPGNRA